MPPSTYRDLPAIALPVGEYLRDELDARGWTLAEFADIVDRPVQAVSEIVNGHKEITAETASEIAAATGTEARTWLQMQNTYRLWVLATGTASGPPKLDDVARRARLAELVPMRELHRRGIVPAGPLADQERAVCKLLHIESLDQTPNLAIAARRSDEGEPFSPAQTAWLCCIRKAAAERPTPAKPLDKDGLARFAGELTTSVQSADDLHDVPAQLADYGVRLVYVEPFKSSKIDGAAFADLHGPIIGISGRIARFDSVLFTLLHELAHVYLGHTADGISLDVDLNLEAVGERELAANATAGSWALKEEPSITEPISRAKVFSAAQRLGVSPAIIVGRLHHRGALPWSHLNNLIPIVREELAAWG